MSRAEKRHFKLYTGSNNKLRYVRLFDLLEKQKQYNKAAIEKAGFTPSNCNELNEKIHESLHVLRMGKNVDSKLKLLLDGVPMLVEKELINETKKHINKIKKIAKKHQKFLALLEVIRWEKELVAKGNNKNMYEQFEVLLHEENRIRQRLDEETNYQNIKRQLYLLRKKDVRLTKAENREIFNQLLDTACLKTENTPYSTDAKVNFYYAKTVVAKYNNQKEKAYQYAQQLIQIFEENKPYMKQELLNYKYSLCLLAEMCFFSGKDSKIPEIIDKIEQIPFDSQEDTEIYNTVCLQGLLWAMSDTNEQEGIRYIRVFEQLLDKSGDKIRDGRLLAFFYNISVFYSLFDRWREAEKWLNNILTFKRTDDRKDIQFAARLIKFIIMYGCESDDMDNHIQATSNYFRKHQQYTEINQHILQVFRDLYKAINRKERLQIWENLNNFLTQKIQEQTYSTRQLGLEELQLWCQAKLQNTTIATVIATASPSPSPSQASS